MYYPFWMSKMNIPRFMISFKWVKRELLIYNKNI